MKRLYWLLIMTIFVSFIFFGCGKKDAAQVDNLYQGYNTQFETEQGGAPLEDANACTIGLQTRDGTQILTFGFKSGSRMSGTEAETEAETPPPYEIWMEDMPARLMIRLEGVTYWDYMMDEPIWNDTVWGMFRYTLAENETAAAPDPAEVEEPADSDADQQGESAYLCFQLSQRCAYKAEEADGGLQITLLPMPAVESEKTEEEETADPWFLVGNAFRDYCLGRLEGAQAFTPTYAADLTNILLISAPYASELEAGVSRKQLLQDDSRAVEGEWSVVQLPANSLPAFDENMKYGAAFQEQILRRNGEAQTAEVFLADGLYLSAVPKRAGGGILYSRRITEGMGEDSYSYEQLYIRDAVGKERLLVQDTFAAVEKALFSPDGRRLAVLERVEERTNLYIVDMEMREISGELTRSGFGDLVSDICWDSMGSVLYAVSGSEGMAVNAYDFNVPDETKRHTVIDRDDISEGHIGYRDGEIYFVQSEMEKEIICRIQPEGSLRREFEAGSAFKFSPGNEYMAISTASGISGSGGQNGLFLLHMETGKLTEVCSDFGVYTFLWSLDGTRLYYFENTISEDTGDAGLSALEEDQTTESVPVQSVAADPYPYTLWAYDVAGGHHYRICDLPGTGIYASPDPEQLFFTYCDGETMGEKIRATYRIEAVPAEAEE